MTALSRVAEALDGDRAAQAEFLARRAVTNRLVFNEWGFIEAATYFSSAAAVTRAAFRR
jgi:hypothetical protein